MRKLDDNFLKDLKEGQLKDLLNYVKSDNTLDLEIRENYINIYYSGGNILKVIKVNGSYIFSFDYNYLKLTPFIKKETLKQHQEEKKWNSYFPIAKQAMDFYFSKSPNLEREFQQLIVRENNYSSIANSTDFFVIDIEYDNHDNARFDIIACEWTSIASDRKLQKNFKPKLVIIEMKYGDNALTGSSGMKKHCDDYNSFTSDTTVLSNFKSEMLGLFKQKRELGLIPCLSGKGNNNEITEFDNSLELIFLIANHDPASTILKTELSGLINQKIKFITSNFMGYGLYNQNIFDLNQFLTRFPKQINEI